MNFRFLSKMYASAIYVFFLNLVTCKQTTRRTVIFGYECYDCYAVRHRLKSVIIIFRFIVSFVHFYVCQSIHLVSFPQKDHVNKNSCLPLYILKFPWSECQSQVFNLHGQCSLQSLVGYMFVVIFCPFNMKFKRGLRSMIFYKIGCEFKKFTGCERRMHLLIYLRIFRPGHLQKQIQDMKIRILVFIRSL